MYVRMYVRKHKESEFRQGGQKGNSIHEGKVHYTLEHFGGFVWLDM